MNFLYKFFLVLLTLSNFHTAIFDKLGFLNKETIYKIRGKNINFIARGGTEDMAEIVVVMSGDEYEVKNVNLPKNPLIVDIGGHIGAFSIYISSHLKKRCKVYVFEPDVANFKILKRNLKINNVLNCKAINKAIAGYNGKGFLKKEDLNTDAYFLDRKSRKKNCDVVTLPLVAKKSKIRKIDLLKMDIEGAEYDIFFHKLSYSFIKKNVHYIFMEYHNINKKRTAKKLINYVQKDFKILKHRKSVLTLENNNWNYA